MMNEQPKKKSALLPVSQLHTFEGHPYKVLDNEEMEALIESIKEQGILSPLIVRPLEDGEYEVISGHRRLHAADKAGLTEIPALIYPLDRNEAILAVVDSNLHREHILPSEKAFAYKLKMEALKQQGKRTLSQVATKTDTAAEIGKETDESRDQVFRYIRLTYLIPELMEMVDEGKIAFSPAVELSYLSEKEQRDLLLFTGWTLDEYLLLKDSFAFIVLFRCQSKQRRSRYQSLGLRWLLDVFAVSQMDCKVKYVRCQEHYQGGGQKIR